MEKSEVEDGSTVSRVQIIFLEKVTILGVRPQDRHRVRSQIYHGARLPGNI